MTKSDQSASPSAPESTPADGAPAALDALRAQLAEAEQKASENWDRALRATAELENVRRRVERDAASHRKYALEGVLTDLIQVTDSLELALKAIQAAPADAQAHLEGVELTYKQFWSVLERNGVSVIDPLGQPFNPDLHQAVSTEESAERPANEVVGVLQKGYRLHDRVLRPAMVTVSRAPGGAAGTGA